MVLLFIPFNSCLSTRTVDPWHALRAIYTESNPPPPYSMDFLINGTGMLSIITMINHKITMMIMSTACVFCVYAEFYDSCFEPINV